MKAMWRSMWLCVLLERLAYCHHKMTWKWAIDWTCGELIMLSDLITQLVAQISEQQAVYGQAALMWHGRHCQ
jgi:hypothetical protein